MRAIIFICCFVLLGECGGRRVALKVRVPTIIAAQNVDNLIAAGGGFALNCM